MLFLFMLVICQVHAQQDSIDYWRGKGIDNYHAKRFETALNQLRIAKTFTGDYSDIDDWIDRTFDGYVVLLKNEVKASELAGQAYKLAKHKPTYALRVAEEAVRIKPDNSNAVQQLHDIASVYPSNFFSTLIKHTDGISAVAISPDNQQLLSGGMDDTARLWNIDGELLAKLPHDEPIRDVSFDPKQNRILTAGSDNVLKIWKYNGELLKVLKGHSGDISAFDISPDGAYIVTVGWDTTMIIWDRYGTEILKLKNIHDDYISDVAFSPNGQFVLTAGWDRQAKLWSINGAFVRSFIGHAGAVMGVAFSGNGQRIATGSTDQSARVWETATGQLVRSIDSHPDVVYRVAFWKEQSLFTTCHDGIIRLWDAHGQPMQAYKGHYRVAWRVALSDDQRIMLSGSTDGLLLRWELTAFEDTSFYAHTGGIESLSVSSDGQEVLTIGRDNKVKIWNENSWRTVNTIDTHRGVMAAAFEPDSGRLFWGGSKKQVFYKHRNDEEKKEGGKVNGNITKILFTADGKSYFTASWDNLIAQWHTKTDTLINYCYKPYAHKSRIYDIVLSPDEEYIYSASRDARVIKWSLSTYDTISIFRGHQRSVLSIDCTKDGKRLVSAGADGKIILWDQDGNIIRTFIGHQGGVFDAVFSPNGKYVLSAGEDKTARLWDLQGRQIQTMHSLEAINRVAFSPDGKQMYTASNDGYVRVYNHLSYWLAGKGVYKLSEQEKIRFAIFNGDFVEETIPWNVESPFYVLNYRKRHLDFSSNALKYYFFNSHTYSRKAYYSAQVEEKIVLQQIALKLQNDVIDQVLKLKRGNLNSARSARAFSLSNMALWKLMEGNNNASQLLIKESLEVDSTYKLGYNLVFTSRNILFHLLNSQFDEAIKLFSELEASDIPASNEQLIAQMTGKQYAQGVTVRNFLLEEINLLQSYSSEPALQNFKQYLSRRP
jgi:WD40 repeat protein